jgi:hypothetical protein
VADTRGARETVAILMADGSLAWFSISEAQRWIGTASGSGELFRVAGRWALLGELDAFSGLPAEIIDDARALEWLTLNGFEPPAELANLAERRRLQAPDIAEDDGEIKGSAESRSIKGD